MQTIQEYQEIQLTDHSNSLGAYNHALGSFLFRWLVRKLNVEHENCEYFLHDFLFLLRHIFPTLVENMIHKIHNTSSKQEQGH